MNTFQLAMGVVFLGVGASAHSASLCRQSEGTYFSCSAGSKIVSLCASNPISKDRGYLQYRFGAEAHVELQYPERRAPPHEYFTRYSSAFAHGWVTHINFQSGEFTYAIYNSAFGGDEKAGVKVVKGGKVVSDIRCTMSASARLYDDTQGLFKHGGGYEYWLFEP